jgi:hypothetical protein
MRACPGCESVPVLKEAPFYRYGCPEMKTRDCHDGVASALLDRDARAVWDGEIEKLQTILAHSVDRV